MRYNGNGSLEDPLNPPARDIETGHDRPSGPARGLRRWMPNTNVRAGLALILATACLGGTVWNIHETRALESDTTEAQQLSDRVQKFTDLVKGWTDWQAALDEWRGSVENRWTIRVFLHKDEVDLSRCVPANTGASIPKWAREDADFQKTMERFQLTYNMMDHKDAIYRSGFENLGISGDDTLLVPAHHHRVPGQVFGSHRPNFVGNGKGHPAIQSLIPGGGGDAGGTFQVPDQVTDDNEGAGPSEHHPRSAGIILAYCRGPAGLALPQPAIEA